MNGNKQTGRSNGGRVANSSLAIIALLVLCNLLVCRPASGRYLPTRADDTELEILKDLIRGVGIFLQIKYSSGVSIDWLT